MWSLGCVIYEMTFLSLKTEVDNTEKILFISEEEQENFLSDQSSDASTQENIYSNKIDSYAVKNILKIIGSQSEESLKFIKKWNSFDMR